LGASVDDAGIEYTIFNRKGDMMYTQNEIVGLIKNGENSSVEFKNENFHSDRLAKEIVAFANFEGGTILIGVEDDGIISGVSSKKVEERIINICRNNVHPSIIPRIMSFDIHGEKIYIVHVSKGKFRPYKLKTSNKFYIRAGSVSIEPTNEELIRLFQSGEQLHFEISALPGTTLQQIDLLRFKTYCNEYRKIGIEESELKNMLYNLEIVTENQELTVLGMLFFGKNIERYLPQAGIELNCFSGTNLDSAIIDHKSDCKDIPTLIDLAETFIKYNSQKRGYFNEDETRRIDRYDYEPFVVRELVVNAFIHRDWSIFGQKVRISLFKDRLEIFSPGGLPNTLNLQKALSGISYYRNPIIAQMVRDYNLCEKMGRGLYKIINSFKGKKLKMPDFVFTLGNIHNADGFII
jgi:ATP-dependent DNA helicase RecG